MEDHFNKSDFTHDNKSQNIYDEEELNIGKKIDASANKMKKIVIVVAGFLLLFGCLLGDRIIKISLSEGRITDGKVELVQAIDRMAKGEQSSGGYFVNAIKSFDRAIKENRHSYEAHYLKGVTAFHWYVYEKRRGNTDIQRMDELCKTTEESLIKAIRIRNNYPEAHIYLGAFYYFKGMNEKATEELDKGIKTAEKVWKDKDKKIAKWVPYAENTKELIKNNKTDESMPPFPEGMGL